MHRAWSAPQRPWVALLLWCVLLGQAPRLPGQCHDTASSTTCELYLIQNGWACGHTVATDTVVRDVCASSCAQPPCGAVSATGNANCFGDTNTYSSCCNMATSVAGDTSCWTGGRSFETCCLNLAPCRGYDCGPYGTCVVAADGFSAGCTCTGGYASSSTDGTHWCDTWEGNDACWTGSDTTGVERTYNHCCDISSSAEGTAACWTGHTVGAAASGYSACQCADPRCRSDRLSDCSAAGWECLASGSGSGTCVCATGYSGSSCSYTTGTDPCAGVVCGSHGRCIAGACSCDYGYFSSTADTASGNCDQYLGNTTCWGTAPASAWGNIFPVSGHRPPHTRAAQPS